MLKEIMQRGTAVVVRAFHLLAVVIFILAMTVIQYALFVVERIGLDATSKSVPPWWRRYKNAKIVREFLLELKMNWSH